jgi:hypothetical protein
VAAVARGCTELLVTGEADGAASPLGLPLGTEDAAADAAPFGLGTSSLSMSESSSSEPSSPASGLFNDPGGKIPVSM